MIASLLSSPRSSVLVGQRFSRRSLLLTDSSCLWSIKAGVVRTLTVLEDGTSITLGLWRPGDVVGRVLSKADLYEIECLTAVEAVLLPPHVWHEATEALILHVQRAEELIEILHCRHAEASLLQLFS